jgi:predicted outer membrane repeat protein
VDSAVINANPGDTIYICPGTYVSNSRITITENLTLIGAGSGAGGTVINLDGERGIRVYDAEVELRDLQVTGGKNTSGGSGGGIESSGTLTLTGVLVTGNTAERGGGISNNSGATLILNDGTAVINNTARQGGGVFNSGTVILNGGTVTGNTPDDCRSC